MLFIFSTPVLIRHLWQLKAVIFLHWGLICALQLITRRFEVKQYLKEMAQKRQVDGVSRYGQRPLVNIVTSDLKADLALVVEPPGNDAVDLESKV